jgi:beta-lactamase regulating signal transducer with metallopeptidase domain
MISVLVEAALRALLVALVVWAGLRALRVGNVLAQKAAWGMVLAAALLMPWAMRWQGLPAGVGMVVPAHPWQAMQQMAGDARPGAKAAATSSSAEGTQAREDFSATSQNLPGELNRFPAPAISGSGSGAATNSTPAPTPVVHRSFPRPATLGWLLYLAVCAGLLVRLIYGLGAAARLWMGAEPVAADSLPGPSSRLAEGLRLRSSRTVASPITIGSGVVLPAEYLEWDAVKLRIVLAHERSHVRQCDFYLQMLAGLYAIVFWFSPLGWWLKRKLSDLGETISDRAGLREAANGSSYAQILLEFAAAPRLTIEGVAMARRSNLSERIERLLDDSIFHQAFVGGRRRALVAVLLVPAALFAATALIRVEAAGQAQQPAPAPGQSHPEQAEPAAEPAENAATPEPSANSRNAPAEDAQTTTSTQVNVNPEVHVDSQVNTDTQANTNVTVNGHVVKNRSFSYNVSPNGESYALVTGPGDHFNFSGNWTGSADEQIEKARKLAHGKFLWFTRNGKSYFLDDPATLAQIEAMYRPMEALGRQQEALGRQQAELGKQQEQLGREMEKLRAPTPEASKEIEELKAEMAALKAQMKKNASPEELAEMGGKMGELGGRLGALEGEMGARQGELGGKMGALGALQGKLGEQQGKLGSEQGRMAQEADRKVKSIMDQSLRDGKARPVE